MCTSVSVGPGEKQANEPHAASAMRQTNCPWGTRFFCDGIRQLWQDQVCNGGHKGESIQPPPSFQHSFCPRSFFPFPTGLLSTPGTSKSVFCKHKLICCPRFAPPSRSQGSAPNPPAAPTFLPWHGASPNAAWQAGSTVRIRDGNPARGTAP